MIHSGIAEDKYTEMWAFTVKYNRGQAKHVSKLQYAPFIAQLQMWGKVDEEQYEHDSSGRLHVHGIVRLPKNFLRQRFMTYGFHYKMEPIYDRHGWLMYCKKERAKEMKAYMDKHPI